MNANQIDKFIMYCEPTSQNVEYLAKILIHIKKNDALKIKFEPCYTCLLYTSPSPRDLSTSRMPSSA